MQIRHPYLARLAVVALLGLNGGCDRKGGDGTTETATPAPEIVMPETAQPTAVESAPTLTPPTDSSAAPPTLPMAGAPTVSPPTTSAAPAMPGTGPAVPMPPPADPLLSVAQGKAAAIDAGVSGYTMRNQPQVFGDVRSDVSVYSRAGDVVLIEEKLTTSDNSLSTNRYYFDGGSLFFYQDDGRWLDVEPPKPLVTRNTKRSMAFTATGKLITAAKTVDGTVATLGEYEAVAVLARAQQLLGGPSPAPAAAAADKSSPSAAAKAEPARTEPAKAAPPEKRPPAAASAAAAKTDEGSQRVDGARNGTLRGTAPVRGTRDFVIQGRAGQLLTLSLSGAPTAVFAVYSSRGEIVSELTNWSSKLPRDGDYTIKVGQKGGSAPADFALKLTLE